MVDGFYEEMTNIRSSPEEVDFIENVLKCLKQDFAGHGLNLKNCENLKREKTGSANSRR